jgi:uncharacterized membrane protein YedE/YeeE
VSTLESIEKPVWSRADTIRTSISGAIILALLITAYFLQNSESFGEPAALSLLIGSAFGLALERGRYCFFCIFRDSIDNRYNSGILAIVTSLAVGNIGYLILFGLFLPNPEKGTLPPVAHIGPVTVALVFAAFIFGIGMSLSGACVSGHLYRITQGSLRAIPSLIGVVIGFIVAFATWNPIYDNIISKGNSIWLPHYFGYVGSFVISIAALAVIAGFALKSGNQAEYRRITDGTITFAGIRDALIKRRWNPFVTGTFVGLIGFIAYLRVEPLGTTRQLNSIARNVANTFDLAPSELNGLNTLAGCIGAVSETITNNGWLVIGLVVTAFAAALSGNRVKREEITVKSGGTALLGGILLGWGSMTALGCTIGNLVSGTQAFALSGWVFFGFTFLGAYTGIKLKLNKIA